MVGQNTTGTKEGADGRSGDNYAVENQTVSHSNGGVFFVSQEKERRREGRNALCVVLPPCFLLCFAFALPCLCFAGKTAVP